jgi:hypothetical protein
LTAGAVAAPAHATSVTVALAWLVAAACSTGSFMRYLAARRARRT